jgi:hypothetical protein
MGVKAVIDRFEEGKAVLLLGDDAERLVVERRALPKEAREGDWLLIEVEDGLLASAEMDPEARKDAEARIQSKLERLRQGKHLQEE